MSQPTSLHHPQNFESRADMLDDLEFLLLSSDNPQKIQAQQLKSSLEAIDLQLFTRLRAQLPSKAPGRPAVQQLLEKFPDLKTIRNHPPHPGPGRTYVTELEKSIDKLKEIIDEKEGHFINAFRLSLLAIFPFIICIIFHTPPNPFFLFFTVRTL